MKILLWILFICLSTFQINVHSQEYINGMPNEAYLANEAYLESKKQEKQIDCQSDLDSLSHHEKMILRHKLLIGQHPCSFKENQTIIEITSRNNNNYCEINTSNISYKGSCTIKLENNGPDGLGILYIKNSGDIVLGNFKNHGKNSNLDGGLGVILNFRDQNNDVVFGYKDGEIINKFSKCNLNAMSLDELKKSDILYEDEGTGWIYFKDPYKCLTTFLCIKNKDCYGVANPGLKWQYLNEPDRTAIIENTIQLINLYKENRSNIKKKFSDYLENNYGKFDLDIIIKTKNLNILKYEKEYLKKDFPISIPNSRLIFKKIEKGSRTVYGNRSSISFFGWGGNDSYDECIRTRRYDEMSKTWGSCAEIQVPYFNIFFKDKLQNLEVVCTNVDANHPENEFNNIVEWSAGDSVSIYYSIFSGISEQKHIILSKCKGGN